MIVEIITGRKGVAHVTSYQDQAINKGIFGDFAILNIGDKLEAYVDGNHVHVKSGVVVVQGVCAIIAQGDENVLTIGEIDEGFERVDTIYLQWSKRDYQSAQGIESMNVLVERGAAAREDPQPPQIDTSGNIWQGDNEVNVPIYYLHVTPERSTLISLPVMDNVIINLIDISKSISNKMNFTTDEQLVGTWIDGKPLYQKTVEYLGDHSEFPSGGIKYIPITDEAGTIRRFEGYVYFNRNKSLIYPINYFDDTQVPGSRYKFSATAGKQNNNPMLSLRSEYYQADQGLCGYNVTVWYTKDND